MDTLEATTTVLNLWPTSFRGDGWRAMLTAEFETWDGDQRQAAIDRLKATHNGRRINIDVLRAARSKQVGNLATSMGLEPESDRTRAYGIPAQVWLRDNGLWEAFKMARPGDRAMIRRLVAELYLAAGWQMVLQDQAGSPRDFQPWERIENLINAAERAMTPSENRGMGRKVCYPQQGSDGWYPPEHVREVILPDPPRKPNRDGAKDGADRIMQIAAKHSGLKAGSYAAIQNDPEYQAYLREYTERTGMQPA